MKDWRIWIEVLGVLILGVGLLFLVRSVLAEPDSAEELLATARALEAQGAHQEAMGELDKLILRYPGSDLADDALFMKGEILLGIRLGVEKEGNKAEASRLNNEALPNYKAILENYSAGNVLDDAIRKLAAIYQEEGRVEEGLSYVRSLIQAHPENTAAKRARLEIIRRGVRMAKMSTVDALLRECQDIAASESNSQELAALRLSIARCYRPLHSRKYLALLREALVASSGFPEVERAAKLELAIAYLDIYLPNKREDTERAPRMLEEVISSSPDSKEAQEARLRLARYCAPKDIDRAFSLFREGMGTRANDVQMKMYLNSAVIPGLGEAEQNEKIATHLKRLIDDFSGSQVAAQAQEWVGLFPNPLDPKALAVAPADILSPLGMFILESRKYDIAEMIGDELLRRGAGGVVIKAEAVRAQGRRLEAIQIYQEALEKLPPDAPIVPEIMCRKAATQRDAGDYEGAIATADALVLRYPDEEWAWGALWVKADVYAKYLGDVAKVRETYQQLLDRYPATLATEEVAERLRQLEAR